MKLKNKYYTHPVVAEGSDFYENSKFEVDVNMENKIFNVSLYFKVSIENDYLNELLDNETVIIVYHVECPKTSYRRAYTSKDKNYIVSIPIGDIDQKIEVNSFLVANIDIPKYENFDFAADYRGFSFEIPRGCIMAIGHGYTFYITKTHDELKNTSSIFSIVPIDDNSINEIEYILDEQKIIIRLPKGMHQLYVSMSSNLELQPVMHSMLIVPGLIYTLQFLQNSEEPLDYYEDLRWFRALRKACRLQNININELADINIVKLAQNLMGNPLQNAFDYLREDMIGVLENEA